MSRQFIEEGNPKAKKHIGNTNSLVIKESKVKQYWIIPGHLLDW